MQRDEVRGGTTIRNPSTANLLIDSSDREGGTSANFIIQKKNSILNGFFSRLAVSEVILNWSVPNISSATQNDVFTINIDGVGEISALVLDGNYTVAQALEAIVEDLNNQGNLPPNTTFVLGNVSGPGTLVTLTTTELQTVFTVQDTFLARQLGFTTFNGLDDTSVPIRGAPFLLPYRYIDFVSNDLTYNQALKDATTTTYDRTVLYRWYFAWSDSPQLDSLGFPILQGYTRFCARRDIPFPKQIRWENNMPIGQISFQVFNDQGELLIPSQVQPVDNESTPPTTYSNMEWGMSLLVSED